MVVIHPKDKTTNMLSILYEGLEHTRIDQSYRKRHCLKFCVNGNRIQL